MAFKRSFRRFSPRRSFRRGVRLRAPREPQRWEVGNVVIDQTYVLSAETDVVQTAVVALAQIPFHVGDVGTGQGRALNQFARKLEIGGIVFRYDIVDAAFSNWGEVGSFGANGRNRVQHRVLLCSDRLDAVGQPSSIPNWFTPTSPIVAVSASDPVITAEDQDFPTRIHWQNSHAYNREVWQTGSATSVVAPNTRTFSTRGGANLRLRLALDDTHGLFFHFASRLQQLSPADIEISGQLRILGTIYYRVRFG